MCYFERNALKRIFLLKKCKSLQIYALNNTCANAIQMNNVSYGDRLCIALFLEI